VHAGKAYVVHDTGILNVLDAATGKPIYRARVGGGGYTFSASPVAFGSRVLFVAEDGVSFVLDSGDEYKEIARNDLGEMSLASPAIAGDALYMRTQTKLYKIAR
jgi:outer membrane protein assembly factor BamB